MNFRDAISLEQRGVDKDSDSTVTNRSTVNSVGIGLAMALILPFAPAPVINQAPNNNVTTSATANQSVQQVATFLMHDFSMQQLNTGGSQAGLAAGRAADQATSRVAMADQAIKALQSGPQGGGTNNTVEVAPTQAFTAATTSNATSITGQGSLVTATQQGTYTANLSYGSEGKNSSRDRAPSYTPAPAPDVTTAFNQAPATPTLTPGANSGLPGSRPVTGAQMAYASETLPYASISVADVKKFRDEAMSVLPAARNIFNEDPTTTARAQRLNMTASSPGIA